MKIVLATPLYPPDSGGPATDALLLYTELPSYGIDASVCTFGDVRKLPSGIRHIQYAFNLYKVARTADAIVAFDTFSVLVPAIVVGKLLRKPVIVRVPGDFVWEQATQRFGVTDSIEVFQKKKYGVRVALLRNLQKWAAQQSALLVVPSDFFKGIVEQWGISPDRVERIYLGVDMEQKFVVPHESVVPKGKILFSLGRLVPWKGFSMLLDLICTLPDEWHLIVAGDGPVREELEKKANALGVAKRVTFTGALPRAEVLGWLRRADAFVLNTSFESFSFQVVEAMWSGIPVLTTPGGSLPELITNGIEGVLCSHDDLKAFTDAVLSTQSEPEIWERRTEAAQKKAELFSIKNSLDSFVKEIKTICD